MDYLRVVTIANGLAIATAFVTALIIAFSNAGSRNIVLATGTLGAAMLLYALQLPFELRRSLVYDQMSAEFTVDRAAPGIRQWAYSSTADASNWRLHAEVQASSWLAQNNPGAFEGDRDKVTKDLAIFSLLSFFSSTEFDWQLRRVTYKGRSSGTLMTWQAVSKPNECAIVTSADVAVRLAAAGNLFAGAPLLGSEAWCLPPQTKLEVWANSVVLRNPVFQIQYTVTLSGSVSYMKPGTGGDVPTLPSDGAQFETRWIGIGVETTYFALRAQHRAVPRYREWATRVVNG